MEENGIDPERVIDSIVGREDVYLILYFEDIAENIQDYLDTEYPGCELKVVDHILDSNVYQITENR